MHPNHVFFISKEAEIRLCPNLQLRLGHNQKTWRLSDVSYPSRLIAYEDLDIARQLGNGVNEYPWPHCSKRKKGYVCGFLDGHADFQFTSEFDIQRYIDFHGEFDPIWGIGYNLDATPGGVKGWDLK